MKRRELLKLGAASALAPWAAMQAGAQAAPEEDYRALVCVFLLGGNDGNNLIVPTDTTPYARYRQARANLAIPREQLLAINPANSNGAAYGLHPALGGVQALFNSGQAAVVANTGPLMVPTSQAQWATRSVPLPLNLYSHSDQQGMWQSAIADGPARNGWGGRLLERLVAEGSANRGYSAVSLAGGNVWESGDTSLTAYRVSPSGNFGFDFYNPAGSADPLSAAVGSLLAETSADPFAQTWLDMLDRSLDNQRVLTGALATGTTLATAFPETGLGVQLRMAARLIAARQALGLKRQCFYCSIGGFDTHGDDQLQRQQEAFTEIGDAVAAFHAATVELGVSRQATLFTASDFGRTLASNGQGSDHGWGSHHLVVGGSVRGQRIVGSFPELVLGGPDDAGEGVWIPTTSIDQFGGELARWFGADTATVNQIFPRLGHFDRDIGLMSFG
ncbi:MAG TPA: DUF1501 domain-containing protein [Ideonella sp.]|nr:DUF1501 domain-containing protein [Ideonella sp.]